jgi:hypothetical protein
MVALAPWSDVVYRANAAAPSERASQAQPQLPTSLAKETPKELSASRSPRPAANKPPTLAPGHRLREGAELIDQPGHFQRSGDRILFVARPSNGRFVVLENLNLERIARIVAERPQDLPWKVTGTVTEFRGTNFILIRRATLGGPSLLDTHPSGSMMEGKGLP